MRFLTTNSAKTVDGGIHWDETTGKAMLAIFERAYWSRIWVVQEFVLPERLLIICGANHFDGSYLFELLKVMRYEESRLLPPLSSQILQTLAFELINLRHFWSLWKDDSNPGFFLRYLLVSFREFQSSDLRDKIYALFALAMDASGLKIDYNKSLLDLYIDVLRHLIGLPSRGVFSILYDSTKSHDDAIRLYPGVHKARSDRAALSQILRESLGLSLLDVKVQEATRRFIPYFEDMPFQMPSWYTRFAADYQSKLERSFEKGNFLARADTSKGFKDNLNNELKASLADNAISLNLSLAQGEQDRKLSHELAEKAKLDAKEDCMGRASYQ